MSVQFGVHIYCDGGDKCPVEGIGDQDTIGFPTMAETEKHVTQIRNTLHRDGWYVKDGKDYCPDCWKCLHG